MRQANSFGGGRFVGPRFNKSDILVSRNQEVPTTFDRQVDVVDQPLIPGGGGATPGPFAIVDASTGGSTPAANIQVTYGVLYPPTLGTNIDVTLGGVSLTLAPTLNFSGAGTYFVYLAVDLTPGSPSATIQSTTGSVPVDDPTSNLTYMILGVVTVVVSGSGLKVSTIQQAITSSLIVVQCALSTVFFWNAL